jgi:hypothetical protein
MRLSKQQKKRKKISDDLDKHWVLYRTKFFCCNYYITDRQAIIIKEKHARVAQSVERVAFNHNVQGSSPCSGGRFIFYSSFRCFINKKNEKNFHFATAILT